MPVNRIEKTLIEKIIWRAIKCKHENSPLLTLTIRAGSRLEGGEIHTQIYTSEGNSPWSEGLGFAKGVRRLQLKPSKKGYSPHWISLHRNGLPVSD